MIVILKGLANIAILRVDNSSQYQRSSQTGARSACHSLRPQANILYTSSRLHIHICIHVCKILNCKVVYFILSDIVG